MLDLSHRDALRGAAGLVAAVQKAAGPRETVVLGAEAWDWQLRHALGAHAGRSTVDVDLAMATESWEDYMQVRERLLVVAGFRATPDVMHRLQHPVHGLLDLVPFGGIEDAAGKIIWPAPDETEMQVLGFREASLTSVDVLLPGGVRARVVALPVLALLKVMAWEARRAERPKVDAQDLLFILRHYELSQDPERLYLEYPALLTDPHFDDERFSAWLAGRDAREALTPAGSRGEVISTALRILEGETEPNGALRLVHEVTDAHGIKRHLSMLRNFARGLRGESSLTE